MSKFIYTFSRKTPLNEQESLFWHKSNQFSGFNFPTLCF